MKSSHNLLHDWKEARLERSYISQVGFLGSSIRTSFLRAWLVTVVKVFVVFTLLNMHIDVATKIEENVALLDRYVHNDFAIPEQPLIVARSKPKPAPVIVSINLEPRGPGETQSKAEVAGDSTSTPSSSSDQASQ